MCSKTLYISIWCAYSEAIVSFLPLMSVKGSRITWFTVAKVWRNFFSKNPAGLHNYITSNSFPLPFRIWDITWLLSTQYSASCEPGITWANSRLPGRWFFTFAGPAETSQHFHMLPPSGFATRFLSQIILWPFWMHRTINSKEANRIAGPLCLFSSSRCRALSGYSGNSSSRYQRREPSHQQWFTGKLRFVQKYLLILIVP